jgi:hypothetical protein
MVPGLRSFARSMAASGYAPRQAEEAVLYQVVAEKLETFLARAQDRNRPAPRFVEREFRRFLECGIFAHVPASSLRRLRRRPTRTFFL